MERLATCAFILLLVSLCYSDSFSNETVQFAWFYKPPTDGNPEQLRKNYQTFILTKNDEGLRDELKKKGVTVPILQYLRFDAIEDPGSCSAQPRRNQVADQPGDFCDIQQRHADWFLLDTKGERIQSKKYYLMDPRNHLWRLLWLDRAKDSQQNLKWEGVFLDNVEASLSKLKQKNTLPGAYRSDSQYQVAIEAFLSFIYNSHFKPSRTPLFANIIALTDSNVWFRYLRHLDGAMLEAFAVDWERGYRKVQEWEEQLLLAEKTQEAGKRIILVSQGQKTDQSRQQFAYASYLLISNGRASFRYTRLTNYAEQWFYPNYQIRLGRPLGRRFKKGDQWQREFEHAVVSVNPEKHTAEITSRK
jgi:hypothetical protein